MGYTFVDLDSLEGEGPGGAGPLPPRRPRFHEEADRGRRGLEFVTFGAPIEARYEPPDWG